MRRWLAKLLGILVPTIACLLLVEMGYRLIGGVPLFSLRNFRNTDVTVVNLSDASRYDPVLGWALKDNLRYNTWSTTAYGIRRNNPEQEGNRPGHILVVGSSFTAGSGVTDEETWTSQLEQLIGEPVDNAAVGGYAMDQVVLRAEQLLPLEHPKILVVEVMDASIYWTRYAVDPRPKPYYTVESGKLVEHNIPVPLTVSETDRWDSLKTALGYSYVIDRVMGRLDPYGWFGTGGKSVRSVQNDGVDVTCRLLQRLRQETEDAHIRAVLFANFAAQEIAKADTPPPSVAMVEDCARSMGYQIIDGFKEWRSQYEADPSVLNQYFPLINGGYGHPSAGGHAAVARLIAAALTAPAATALSGEGDAADYSGESFVPGDGQNLLPDSESLAARIGANSIARIDPGKEETDGQHSFTLTPLGPNTEHYIIFDAGTLGAGPYTLSALIRPHHTSKFRLQLVGLQGNGVVGDFDFGTGASSTDRVGNARYLSAKMEPLSDGWARVSLTASMGEDKFRIVMQLYDSNGERGFLPGPESVDIRAVQLERGESASPYQPTSGPKASAQ